MAGLRVYTFARGYFSTGGRWDVEPPLPRDGEAQCYIAAEGSEPCLFRTEDDLRAVIRESVLPGEVEDFVSFYMGRDPFAAEAA